MFDAYLGIHSGDYYTWKKNPEIKAVHPKFMNGDGAFFWPSHGVFVPCLGHGRHGIDFEYLTRRF